MQRFIHKRQNITHYTDAVHMDLHRHTASSSALEKYKLPSIPYMYIHVHTCIVGIGYCQCIHVEHLANTFHLSGCILCTLS